MDKIDKDIQTEKAGKELVKEFLDYANVADASYAQFEVINHKD